MLEVGWWGVSGISTKITLKRVKAETVHGGGVLKKSPPLPPEKQLIAHYIYVFLVQVELLCRGI